MLKAFHQEGKENANLHLYYPWQEKPIVPKAGWLFHD